MPYGSAAAPIAQARWIKALAVVVVLLLSACASQLPDRAALEYAPSLLSGERLFTEPVASDEAADVAMSEPSEAMRAYVAGVITDAPLATLRLRRLLDGLTRDGFFNSVYSAHSTLTAAETFEAKGGNCLSYTSMFLALAREAGLNAVYQIVDLPPAWDADSEFLIRYTHINVLLRNVRLENRNRGQVTVDFNVVHADADYPRREVSDDYAKSLFYANHSVALLRQNRPRESFAHLRRAIELEPRNLDLWINLGALYATQRDFDSAVEAYQMALQLDRNSKAAFSGLARSHASLGNHQVAEAYARKVRHYRESNPYYHFALARAAFENAEFERSLESINTAIELKRRIPRFHLLKGLLEQKLGHTEAAEASFRQAKRHGLDPRVMPELLQLLAGMNSS